MSRGEFLYILLLEPKIEKKLRLIVAKLLENQMRNMKNTVLKKKYNTSIFLTINLTVHKVSVCLSKIKWVKGKI